MKVGTTCTIYEMTYISTTTENKRKKLSCRDKYPKIPQDNSFIAHTFIQNTPVLFEVKINYGQT